MFNFSHDSHDYLVVFFLLLLLLANRFVCSPVVNYLELFLSLALPSKESRPGMADRRDICSPPDAFQHDGKTNSTCLS